MLTAKNNKKSRISNVKAIKEHKNEPQKKTKATSAAPTTVDLRGVQVHFPFKPYKCQEEYMGKVLDALNSSENALLESPTGTGKTLCLLCSTLAWQQEQSRMKSELSMEYKFSAGASGGTDATGAATQQSQPTNRRASTIIYASRTHSQLSQVVKELRFTRYRPKHAVLGSREQMCVHPKVNTAKAVSSDINHNCTRLNKDRKCRYRNNLDTFVVNTCGGGDMGSASNKGSSFEYGMQPVLDMEELIDLGKKRKVCPFYMTRGQIEQADLIFVPYNYLFDKDARNNTLADVNWENSILIFDEAHNLESFASESASFDLSSVDIAGCVNEVARAIGYLQLMPEMGEASNVKLDNLIRLKSIFLEFEQYLENSIAPTGGSFTGDYIFEIFAKGAKLNHSNHAIFLKFIRQVSDMVMDARGGSSGGNSAASSVTCPKLDHFVGCIKRIFDTSTEGQCLAKARAYRVHVSAKSTTKSFAGKSSSGGGFVNSSRSSGGNNTGRVLSYWCFSPSLAMHELAALNVRSILVTSGTLSPLPSYSLELGLPFPHTLENAHIIGKDQISVRVIGKGVSGKALTSTYNRRDNIEYILELGNTIISISRVIPGGILIFFPSYAVMETCIEKWGGPLSSRSRNQNYGKKNFFQAKQKRTNAASGGTTRYCFPRALTSMQKSGTVTPWQRLMAVKSIVLEPKTTSELKDVIGEFDKFISAPKSSGCIMMGVCRGKISEGIDFADEKCRAVVITGIPFAPYLDPKVKLKREYLDSTKTALMAKPSEDGGFDTGNHKRNAGNTAPPEPIALSGAEWYSQQAHRAVNQAIGRVIRHKADYGAILFLDSRFSEQRNQQGVSKWIRPNFETDNGVGGAIQSLAKFFRGAKAKAGANKILREKETGRGVQLEYEIDTTTLPNAAVSVEKITKVAFVRKVQANATPSGTSSLEDQLLEGYVPSNRIIKQVKLDENILSKKTKPQSTDGVKLPGKISASKGLASIYEPSQIQKVSSMNGEHISETLNSAWSALGEVVQSTDSGRFVRKRFTAKKLLTETGSDKTKEQQKRRAQQFFKMAKASLSPDDFGMVRKNLITLKSLGANKDVRAYMESAEELISLLLQYNDLHSTGQSKGEVLVFLLHSLLPTTYRFQIEKIASRLRLKKSAFYELCVELLTSDDIQVLDEKFPNLMMSHEELETEARMNSTDKTLINDLRAIILMIAKNGLAVNTECVLSMKNLLTTKMCSMATLLIKELRKKQSLKALKEMDRKKYGEDGINKSLFHKPERSLQLPTESTETKIDDDALSKIDSISRATAKNKFVSKQILKNNEVSRARVDAYKKKHQQLSKLGSKSLPGRPTKRLKPISDAEKTPTRDMKRGHTPNRLDPLEKYLQQAKAEIYKKATPKVVRINKQLSALKSNAPNGTACNICNKTATSFFMADCRHFSCLDCWASWLQRSSTCPTCRRATQKESLCRVVFETEVGAGAPSLTQMMDENNDNYSSSDDDAELEIVTRKVTKSDSQS